ncbi:MULTISPECIES: hypothetical protein [Sphingobacterium]|uniref:hypothetical protein n=1 Tax=Sphingobacterium TaxID=28453 RepID=UPI00257ABFA5|nr:MULTISPECIES: hypothetical protein [Sphingobacterium]
MAENDNKSTQQELDPATAKIIAGKDKEIAALTKERDALKSKNEDLTSKNSSLENDLAITNTENSNLKVDNKSLSDSVDALTTERDEAMELMTTMSKSLEKVQKAAKDGFQTLDHKGKTYSIHGKTFFFEGKEFTTENLLEDSELVGRLLKLGVGFLKEVKED